MRDKVIMNYEHSFEIIYRHTGTMRTLISSLLMVVQILYKIYFKWISLWLYEHKHPVLYTGFFFAKLVVSLFVWVFVYFSEIFFSLLWPYYIWFQFKSYSIQHIPRVGFMGSCNFYGCDICFEVYWGNTIAKILMC